MSDTHGTLPLVTHKPPKKTSLIHEPKTLSPALQKLVESAERKIKAMNESASDLLDQPFEVFVKIVNNKVLYSRSATDDNGPGLAPYIVKAVTEYEVAPIEHAPVTATTSRVGQPKVTYDRYVKIDWKAQKIYTNFKPSEGEQFMGAMAIIVKDLQHEGAPEEEGALS